MAPPRRVCLGIVTGAHGVRGEVRVRTFTGTPEALATYGSLEDAEGRRRFDVVRVLVTAKGAVAKLAGVEDRNAAESLRGTELWLERTRLPATDDEEWYVDDLKGLLVVDGAGLPVGRVRAVVDHGAGDVVEIVDDSGRELVLPFTRAQFPEVDVEGGRMVMAPPAFLEPERR